jgi:hypothetical protein
MDLSRFPDHSFDIAFSNSVIEHLFTFENQRRMASEMHRVAKAICRKRRISGFRSSPIFHLPGWQWLPSPLRVSIIRRWKCGWLGLWPDPARARRIVNEIRLMTRTDIENLFPEGQLMPEHFLGLVKSWTVCAKPPESDVITNER